MKKIVLVLAILGMNVASVLGVAKVKTPKVDIKNSSKNSIQVETIKKVWDKSTSSSVQNVPSKQETAIELGENVIEIKISLKTEEPSDKVGYSVVVK
jgi:hypothetical protein